MTAQEIFNSLDAQCRAAVEYIMNFISDSGNGGRNDILEQGIEIKKYVRENFEESLRGKSGIYVFVVTGDISLSRGEFKNFKKVIYSHRFNRKHERHPGGMDRMYRMYRGEYLYAGTSKNLLDRIDSHYSTGGSTVSLHLAHKHRRGILNKITAYVFPMKEIFNGLNDELRIHVLRIIEAMLYTKKIPLMGSGRT